MSANIPDITLQCAQLLSDAQTDSRVEPIRRIKFQNLLARLKIWAGQLGVMAAGNASIDYRLRNDSDIQTILWSMLTRFELQIKHARDNEISPPLPILFEEEEDYKPTTIQQRSQLDAGTGTDTTSTTSSWSLPLDSDSDSKTEISKGDAIQKCSLEQDAIHRANNTLDQIYRLTSFVRTSISTSEDTKVRQYILRLEDIRDNALELGMGVRAGGPLHIKDWEIRDMEEMRDVEDHVRTHLQALELRSEITRGGIIGRTGPSDRIPETMMERFTTAAIFRRMKYRYRSRHQQKLRQGSELLTPSLDQTRREVHEVGLDPLSTTSSAQRPHKDVQSETSSVLNPLCSNIRPNTLSATNASTVNPRAKALHIGPKAFSVVTSRTAVERREGLEIPVPPENLTECPYCFRLVGAETSENSHWNRHVLQDFEPYMCLFMDCSEGGRLYQSSEDWLTHMQWSHTLVWQCPVPHQEQIVVYSTAGELEQHLRDTHPQAITDADLYDLVQRNAIPAEGTFAILAAEADPSRQCPFCDEFDTQLDIRGHILTHLEQIALMSLPPKDGSDEESSKFDRDELQTNRHSIVSSGSWGSVNLQQRRSGRELQAPLEIVHDRGFQFRPVDLDSPLPPLERSDTASSVQFEPASLNERLDDILCESEDGREYYPHGLLEALLTVNVVFDALAKEKRNLVSLKYGLCSGDFTEEKIAEYAAKVCASALKRHEEPGDGTSEMKSSFCKMFAILVRIKRPWDIVLLVDDDIRDAYLPLLAVSTGKGKRHNMRLRTDTDNDLRCFSQWSNDPSYHKDFELHQWATIAPFFCKGNRNNVMLYQLSPKDILPWKCVENEPSVTEGYSWVTHVQIHPNHHNFEDSELSDGTYAVKHIKAAIYGPTTNNNTTAQPVPQFVADQLRRDFEREIEILNMFSGGSNRHLIKLLVAFQRGDQCCLVFRWAQSDLLKMWKTVSPGPPLEKSSLRWFLEQSHGIASGLNKIHTFQSTLDRTANNDLARNGKDNLKIFGRHGDIKPENILHFVSKNNPEKFGTLVITDFGLCRFHSETSRTYLPSRPHQRTPTYRPPECEMKGAMISRSLDIWSLGCVLLEFVSWYLGGWELVDKFVVHRKAPNLLMHGFNSDQFFEIVSVGDIITHGPQHIRVKLEVHEFVENQLHTHPECTDIVHRLLDFIMERMLIVEGDGLRTRANCPEVLGVLSELCKELDSLPTLEGKPRASKDLIGNEPDAVPILLTDESWRMLQKRPEGIRQHRGRTINTTEDGRGRGGGRMSSPRPNNTSPSSSPTREFVPTIRVVIP